MPKVKLDELGRTIRFFLQIYDIPDYEIWQLAKAIRGIGYKRVDEWEIVSHDADKIYLTVRGKKFKCLIAGNTIYLPTRQLVEEK